MKRFKECVNALNGLLLISSCHFTKTQNTMIIGVNALNGLLLISSSGLDRKEATYHVSMPSTGFYLFLLSLTSLTTKYQFGVNALNGLLLISSKITNPATGKLEVCQCPQRASTYFFQVLEVLEQHGIECQCPQRASTYFFSTLPEPLILLSSGEVFCK